MWEIRSPSPICPARGHSDSLSDQILNLLPLMRGVLNAPRIFFLQLHRLSAGRKCHGRELLSHRSTAGAVYTRTSDTQKFPCRCAGTGGDDALCLWRRLEPAGYQGVGAGGHDRSARVVAGVFLRQDEHYDYRNYRGAPETVCNPFGWAGADCSGYLGWVVYNTMHSRSGGAGYVRPAAELARALAERYCYGLWTQRYAPEELRPGDVVSIPGHVWICLGQCGDGSAVILHSTPSPSVTGRPGGGVQLSGMGERENCLAVQLARWYMGRYYPEWSRRYCAV